MKYLSLLLALAFLGGCAPTINRVNFAMFEKSKNPLNCEVVEARVSSMLNQALGGCQDKEGKVQAGLVGGNGTTAASVATGLTQAVIVGGAIAGGAALIGKGASQIETGTEIIVPGF